MAQREDGWPLDLQPLNLRVGLVRSREFSGSISLNTLLTGSPSSAFDSSSDLDTEKVEYELLTVCGNQLLEKENSGCNALLGHNKHVIAEGTTLVKQAEDAAYSKRMASQPAMNNARPSTCKFVGNLLHRG